MKKQNKIAKIVATFALLAIILSVVWTGFLILFSPNPQTQMQQELTPEQLQELMQKSSGSEKWDVSFTGITLDDNLWETATGSENK